MIERSKAASPTKRLRSSLRAFGPDGAFREGLRSAFDLEPSDVGPLRLSALGGCAVIAAYGIASPLLEVVALSLGMDLLPLVDVGQTLLVFAVNPLYQYAQRWVLPLQLIGIAYSRRFSSRCRPSPRRGRTVARWPTAWPSTAASSPSTRPCCTTHSSRRCTRGQRQSEYTAYCPVLLFTARDGLCGKVNSPPHTVAFGGRNTF